MPHSSREIAVDGAFSIAWMVSAAGPAYVLVVIFNLFVLLRLNALKRLQQLCRIKRFELIAGIRALRESRCGDDDDWHRRVEGFDLTGKLGAGKVFQTTIQNNSSDGGKAFEGLQCLSTAVGCDDVEFGGFNDEFAG
jgi:hypothetical protein